ncbi:MAG TPA: hypothetical protein VGH07_07730 [Chthoniobacterales bacterium]|jgi:hypothetical protein
MIEPEEIAKWAELYDLGYRNLDLSSEEASAARRELYRLVRERYATLFPHRSVPFDQFNSEAIRKMKAYLRRS